MANVCQAKLDRYQCEVQRTEPKPGNGHAG
jgi:hypothetical protein